MRKKVNDIKIRYKFLLIFVMATITMFFGSLFVSHIMQDAYDKELYNKSVQLLTLFSENVQAELEQVVFDSIIIVSDDILQEELSAMKDSPKKSEKWLNAFQRTRERIEQIRFYSEDIKCIYFRTFDDYAFGVFASDTGISEAQVEHLKRVAHEAKGQEKWVYFPEFPNFLIFTRELREKKNMTLENLGTLIIKINLEDIVKRCSRALIEKDISVQTAIYQSDNMIYASNQVMQEIEPRGEGYEICNTQLGKYFCVYHTALKSDWVYVTAIPYDDIFATVNNAIKISVFVLIGVMLVVCLIGMKMITSIARHIANLIEQCDVFAKGEYKPIDEEHGSYYIRQDEIGKLYRHFDRMATENKKMIQDTYVKQQLLLEAQVSNLQAQIRPHFIYNTLESIYCLAQSGGDERIATMTSALGKLLRFSLKEHRNVIPLCEEMKMVEEYLKIQSVRLGDRMQISLKIEDRFKEILIPSMTIQPLVENAIFYAAEEMQEICEIGLYCKEKEEFVEVVVEDNGPGMNVDILEKLETKQIIPQGMGIGLLNINKRLKLLISKDSGLFVERCNDRTLVIVRLKKIYKK